jgi:hypothetical protein
MIINDLEMAHELLVRRANQTSGRLNTYMAVELSVLIPIISDSGYPNSYLSNGCCHEGWAGTGLLLFVSQTSSTNILGRCFDVE